MTPDPGGPGPHPSEALAEAVVAALAACGVRDVVYCPGSRSAPMAYALDRAARAGVLRARVRLDERGAAFLAVGISRAGALPGSDEGGSAAAADPSQGGSMRQAAGMRPVAVVTTSGGAVAELHAGVAEAAHSGVPLIVVSADRPVEMRGVGASQTTDQPGLLTPHVRGVWDIPAGTAPDGRLRALVARAVATACGLPAGAPGPVHVNIGFRDPLVPRAAVPPAPAGDGATTRAPGASAPVRVTRVARAEPRPWRWEDAVDPDLRTVLVAGDGADPEAGHWALAAGIPLLAEPTSGATTSGAWTAHQQTLLSGPLGPGVQQVVVTGRPTLSRPVGALLARGDIRIVVQSRDLPWTDVAGQAELVVPALGAATARHRDARWTEEWARSAESVTRALLPLTEPADDAAPTLVSAARAVWNAGAGTLLLGASNTVRAVDLVASGRGRADVVSNRGLAGIDGTIATALGLAWGSGGPVRAVMGDLTFLHDASSLMLSASDTEPDAQIVVLDDQGGGIFAGLEHGDPALAGAFEKFFGTAQASSIVGIARAHGARATTARTIGQLRARLARPVRGREVVHVPILRDPELLARVRLACRAGH
jgi:2-succinyl-5-enolpyruvyl-6-hydroxy-3-cyclohexene-1-carboxylate synthase